jgi:hypothetical protein
MFLFPLPPYLFINISKCFKICLDYYTLNVGKITTTPSRGGERRRLREEGAGQRIPRLHGRDQEVDVGGQKVHLGLPAAATLGRYIREPL